MGNTPCKLHLRFVPREERRCRDWRPHRWSSASSSSRTIRWACIPCPSSAPGMGSVARRATSGSSGSPTADGAGWRIGAERLTPVRIASATSWRTISVRRERRIRTGGRRSCSIGSPPVIRTSNGRRRVPRATCSPAVAWWSSDGAGAHINTLGWWRPSPRRRTICGRPTSRDSSPRATASGAIPSRLPISTRVSSSPVGAPLHQKRRRQTVLRARIPRVQIAGGHPHGERGTVRHDRYSWPVTAQRLVDAARHSASTHPSGATATERRA